MNAKVLIYGKDPILLETRCKVLELAGLHCHSVTNLANVLTAIATEPVGVVVVCSSIPKQEVPQVLNSISGVGQSKLKTIVVTLPDISLPKSNAVAIVESPANPQQFIELVTRSISS